jgi:hypothetical protein
MAAYPSRSASQWKHANELTTLSITPTPYPALFASPLPLLPAYVSAAIISNQDMPAPQTGHNDDTLDFFNNLKAYCRERTHESRIDDLNATILRISHCSARRPHFRRYDLPLLMSTTPRWAKPNFVLFSNDGYIRAVVSESTRHGKIKLTSKLSGQQKPSPPPSTTTTSVQSAIYLRSTI